MKIIATDYDGTLNHGGIDDRKRNAIKKWRGWCVPIRQYSRN